MSKKEGKAQMSSPDSSRPSLGHQMEEVSVTNKRFLQRRKMEGFVRPAKYCNGEMQMEREGISPQEKISLPSLNNGENVKSMTRKGNKVVTWKM